MRLRTEQISNENYLSHVPNIFWENWIVFAFQVVIQSDDLRVETIMGASLQLGEVHGTSMGKASKISAAFMIIYRGFGIAYQNFRRNKNIIEQSNIPCIIHTYLGPIESWNLFRVLVVPQERWNMD